MSRAAALLLAAVALAACRPPPAAAPTPALAPPPPATSAQAPATNAPTSAAALAPSVELLEAGAKPRRVLSARPAEPGTETRRVELKIGGTTTEGGMRAEVLAPPIGLDLRVAHGSGAPAPFTATTDAFELLPDGLADPETVLAMQAALDGTGGLVLEGVIAPDGEVRVERLEHPDAANAQHQQLAAALAQVLSLARLRLPAEPVGAGARWRWSAEHRTTLGARMEQELVATLLSLEADGTATLRVESTARGPRQVLEDSPAPEDWTLEVTQATASGSAVLRLEPGRLLPARLEAEGQWELLVLATGPPGASEQRVTQELGLGWR